MDTTDGAMTIMSTQETSPNVIKSGYDFEPAGLATDGQFVSFHSNALSCMAISFICAVTVIAVQFTNNNKPFYRWPTGERFAIYLAVCDGIFNIVHSMDHGYMLITRDHVKPPILCKVFGGFVGYSMHLQLLTVMSIAVNVLWSVRLNKKPHFGKNDRNLYVIVLTAPLAIMIIGQIVDIYGPSGAFCFTDATMNLAFFVILTIPVTIVCVSVTVMYLVSWNYIRKKTMKMSSSYKESSSTRAARNMSLFVLSFLLQWHQSAIFGIYFAIKPPTVALLYLELTFTNLGGLFNLVVYIIIIRRKRLFPVKKSSRTISEQTHKKTKSKINDSTCLTQQGNIDSGSTQQQA